VKLISLEIIPREPKSEAPTTLRIVSVKFIYRVDAITVNDQNNKHPYPVF